ncbi:hypothetical protein FSARC_5815 [Fusarium sarcochroum]|uniref:Macro domain-containing protein n=1 Tax=Fusarium sarcochroum TaxID=1208366 RepID=A0A8H4X959_9HYPO|nr:hypothetical protein FSARC_5815 [Fusarium sarcochroum]
MASNPGGNGNASGQTPNVTSVPQSLWHNTLHPHTPTKRPDQGSYNFIQYCPIWTDPNWQDDGPERLKSDFKIEDNILDRLRPALLPRDQIKRPTKYAQRFSIFPGRTDGRSRTSPTRAESRQLFPANTEVKTGKQLFDRFEELAREKGEHVDDYMAKTRPDMQHLSDIEQQYMQQYEELVVDENWQNILFGSLTMDEILAEGYLPMCDAELDGLSGPLYYLFGRDKWVDTRLHGQKADEPRFMYTLDGHREEWDPRNNDRVWEAIQPALQLATRFVMAEDSFTQGLQDITNRLWVDHRRFAFQPGQTWTVRTKFERDPDPGDPTRLKTAQELGDTGIDAWSHSWDALCQVFEIKLTSGFHFDGKPKSHIMGRTMTPQIFGRNSKVTVEVDAELVWPLIVDKYTRSEKMMASLVFAATLAHEMMHAFACIPYKWLADPDSVGITDALQNMACKSLDLELMERDFATRVGEPFFENDASAEVGHAFESHVLGGGYWPFIHATLSIRRPALLQTSVGLVAHTMWPEGSFNSPPYLDDPFIRNIRLNHFTRFDDVKKYFTQAFWDVAIQKYGTAALREPSSKPHKISYYPSDTWINSHVFDNVTLGTQQERKWIWDFITSFSNKNMYVLESYLNNLVTEACDFDLMIERFTDDRWGWEDRDKIWRKLSKEVLMITCEFTAFAIQEDYNSDSEDVIMGAIGPTLEFYYQIWLNTWFEIQRFPDHQSFLCANGMANDALRYWVAQVRRSDVESYEMRLIPRISDFMSTLERELSHIESMICELYQMGTTYWVLYCLQVPDHISDWRLRVDRMSAAVENIVNAIQATNKGIKGCEGAWDVRMLVLGRRIQDMQRLLDLDARIYETKWRDLLTTMPMLRKSHRKPHQRFYFLAKREMMNLTGEDLAKMKEFKSRFHKLLNLGAYKVVTPEMDPDELNIAQRLFRTLDDQQGSDAREREIKGPSTGIFDIQGVKNLVDRLTKDENDAQEAKIRRVAGGTARGPNNSAGEPATLKGTAAAQATETPAVRPKVQQMGIKNQAVPLSGIQTSNPGHAPFASYSSGTSSPFPSYQGDQPPAWTASNSADLAAWVNKPLGGVRAAHGIMPHPYAIRETVTDDLQNTAAISLPLRNPTTFANQFPRELMEGIQSPQGTGPLGDIDGMWQQQPQAAQNPSGQQSQAATWNGSVLFRPPRLSTSPTIGSADLGADEDVEMMDPSSFGSRVTAVSDFDHSSSDTDVSDVEEQHIREGSETTLVESSDTDEEKAGSSFATINTTPPHSFSTFMFAKRSITMATRSLGEIPTISQLYLDPETGIFKANMVSTYRPERPAKNSINSRIGLIRGDITQLRVDAIVNAANRSLLGGGGVDGAIHRAAGPELVRECKPLGPIETGDAVITKGYGLPAKHVIHTVGPVYDYDESPQDSLASCYHESLKLAVKEGVTTVAFSAISTGIYGFPSDLAAAIACNTVRNFLESEDGDKLLRVVFVTFVSPDVKAYNEQIPKFFPPAKTRSD